MLDLPYRMVKKYFSAAILGFLAALFVFAIPCYLQAAEKERISDAKVKQFLDKMRNRWRDLNVPEADGKILYEIIVQNRYKKALEVGTSTGHSAIWIAWALSKTGGKLITIEIDEGRYKTALKNFKQAGVEEFIDARLADAHQLVKELRGPFDFVFSDADKEWYAQYFKEVDPKLVVGGCFTAHNVTDGFGGIKEFLDYIRSLSNYETTI